MSSDLSLDDYSFNVTERAHKLLDKYSQTHPESRKNEETAPFKTMKDIFMMSVYLGTRLGKPKELDGKKVSPFKGNFFTHEEQLYLHAAAIAWKKDPNVIADPQQVVRIAEQFANAGIWKLDEILSTSDEGPLWDLVDYFHTELESV